MCDSNKLCFSIASVGTLLGQVWADDSEPPSDALRNRYQQKKVCVWGALTSVQQAQANRQQGGRL